MHFEWDETKRLQNLEKHGLDFAEVAELFACEAPLVVEDTREDYGEKRFQGLGVLRGIVVLFVFTPRDDGLRIISMRKANKKERAIYEKAKRVR